MNIAYFVSNRSTIPSAPDQITASTTVVLNIINELKSRHHITVYAAQGSHIDGVNIVDLGLPPFEVDSSLSNSDWITKAVLTMKQIYLGKLFKDATHYDIIHLHTEPSYLAMPFIDLVKTPVLITGRLLRLTEQAVVLATDFLKPIPHGLEKILIGLADLAQQVELDHRH